MYKTHWTIPIPLIVVLLHSIAINFSYVSTYTNRRQNIFGFKNACSHFFELTPEIFFLYLFIIFNFKK